MSKRIQCFTSLGLIFFLICSIVFVIVLWDLNHPSDFYITLVLSRAGVFCWNSGQLCSYFLFLFRLMDTFSESAYKVPKTSAVYLVILLTFYAIAWIIKFTAYFVFWSDWKRGEKDDVSFSESIVDQIQEYMLIPILILDTLISSSMVYMFIYRLFAVMRGQADIVREQHLHMDALNRSLNVDGNNHRLMNLSVKIAVLSILSLLSSLIYIILSAVMWLHLSLLLMNLLHLWLVIDIIITCSCLVLFLSRTDRVYSILCCCCVALGNRCIKRALLKKHRRISHVPSESETCHGISSGAAKSGNVKSEPILSKIESKSLNEPYPLKDIDIVLVDEQ